MNKICGKCNLDKPLEEFAKKKSGRLGVSWECKVCKREAGSKYYQDNKEQVSAYRVTTNEKERQKKWRQANQHVKNYHTAAYRAQEKLATPKWLSKEQLLEIRALYKEAKRLSKDTGIQHHVDHIMPLNNENLSGLHVPWNLQILTARDNITKSNRVDGEAIAGQCNVDLRNFGAPQSSVAGNNCPPQGE